MWYRFVEVLGITWVVEWSYTGGGMTFYGWWNVFYNDSLE